ncbi:MAG: molybdate ABC transporter permease subunit [Rhodocyclaceae bacterium]|nr:molybdate ABC transporter permease subunit [Rhodocyclaceae bacterium]
MDLSAWTLSLKLAAATTLLLLPLAVLIARPLLTMRPAPRLVAEGLVALPLVLPPTVLGFYLLVAFGQQSFLGEFYRGLTGRSLVFSFDGLLAASIVFNLPFAVQPVQRALEAIPREVREAAWCCGLTRWQTLWKIELPLAWPGLLTAIVLTFAHTLGEFGVVLMIGGNIPAETRTVSIAIYDHVQAFEDRAAGILSATLVAFSFAAIVLIPFLTHRIGKKEQ